MDTPQILNIIKSLANGIDPTSGELYALGSPYNHPTITSALFGCLSLVNNPPKKTKWTLEKRQDDNLQKGYPRNSNTPWTEALKIDLAEQFNAAISTNELAVRFERTHGAILAQLKQQGLIGKE